jgi:hypothetical protein
MPRQRTAVGSLEQLVDEVAGCDVNRVACRGPCTVVLEAESGAGHAPTVADVDVGGTAMCLRPRITYRDYCGGASLTGHEGEGTSQTVYKHDTPLPVLRAAIAKVEWPELQRRRIA